MSVYIRGMEIPKSCISCRLNYGEKRPEYGLSIFCPYSNGVITYRDKAFYNGRLDSCGIVSVPDRGRLIDADALAKHLFAAYGMDSRIKSWIVDGFIREVKNAPTIIPADCADKEDGE